jgi:hypothetical protein
MCWLCVNVYCTTVTGCQSNCSKKKIYISNFWHEVYITNVHELVVEVKT